MINDFGRHAQGDNRHSKASDTSDSQPESLLDLLRDAAGITPENDTDQALTLAEQFEAYCANNPVVYDVMVRLCRQWVRQFTGARLGVRALVEKSRWEVRFATKDPHYKVNNNWSAWYGRLIMYREPGMAGLFELRRAPDADAWIRQLAFREGRSAELPRLMGWTLPDDETGRAA
ncbi:hypothetical protein ACIA5A_05895 [Micromonospora sp. NPDC051300]|uniref:hypothetical protein n=1 Tax=Micromonospora sp. NPDC051300 TaxID=3364286 RepID=UPI003799E8C1